MIHPALLVAVHAHPVAAVTETLPVVVPAPTFADVGEIVGAHAAPACVTVKVAPATVTVPVRPAVLLFAATLKVAVPGPEPDAPPVTVIHSALLTAVQAHPTATVTVVLPLPPAAAMDCDAGAIVGAHNGLDGLTEKVLDRGPAPVPPGPTADTTASYTTPAVSGVDSRTMKSIRINPSLSGTGLPRSAVDTTSVPPA